MTIHEKKSGVVKVIKENLKTSITIGLAFFALFVSNLYFYYQNNQNENKINQIQSESQRLAVLLSDINTKYVEALARVDLTEKEKSSLMDAVQRIGMDYNSTLQDYNQKIVEVNTLQKTVSIDDELLSKYSKYYFLNENYKPASSSLSSVDANFTLNARDIKLLSKVNDKLSLMLNDAKSAGIDLIVNSGFRSFEEQQGLKGAYVQKYGLTKSNTFSADQGYSEHQLGSTVDLTDKVSGLTISFEKSKAFLWLKDNAHRYGFIMSYPKGNNYYMYEPWHWRYVGVQLATYIYNNKVNFYDLEQSYIDTYKIKLFE